MQQVVHFIWHEFWKQVERGCLALEKCTESAHLQIYSPQTQLQMTSLEAPHQILRGSISSHKTLYTNYSHAVVPSSALCRLEFPLKGHI